MPPLAILYRQKRHNPKWWWLVAVAYGLFVLLFFTFQPTHINVILSLWAIPLVFVGIVKWLIIDNNDIDNYNRLSWLYLKMVSDSFFKFTLKSISPQQTFKNLFFSVKLITNKVSFVYFILALLTVTVSVYCKTTKSIVFPKSYALLSIQLIFYLYFLFGLSNRISLSIRNFIKKWKLKQIVKCYYPTFDNHIYSDKQLLAWVKQSTEHYYQTKNKTLPNNSIFVIGKDIEKNYYEDKNEDGFFPPFQDILLYKVFEGRVSLIKKNDNPKKEYKYWAYQIDELEDFIEGRFFVDNKIVKELFSELQYDYEKVSILQWQIFLTSKLPKWVKML